MEAAQATRNDAAVVAIEVADAYGIALGDSQRTSIRVGLAETDQFTWASRTHCKAGARQAAGKNNEVECREIAGLTEFGEMLILHTAHEFPTANEAFLRMEQTIENHDALRRQLDRPRYANDEKGFDFLNGARIRYRSRTKKAGKGFAEAALVVLDEAQEILPDHMRALGPTGVANPNSQVWACGTAGFNYSEWWWRQRRRALHVIHGHADPSAFSYLEHTAQEVHVTADGRLELGNPDDLLDPEAWRRAMPRLGDGFVTVDTIMELYERDGPDVFASEMLMLWQPETTREGRPRIVPLEVWDRLESVRSEIVGPRHVAVAVAVDQSWAAIGRAGMNRQGEVHGDVWYQKPGTNWLTEELVAANILAREATGRPLTVRVAVGTAAMTVADDIRAIGLDVIEVSAQDQATSLGRFVNAVNAADFAHLGQGSLRKAIDQAAWSTSTGGSRRLDAKRSEGDISPLEAVVIAVGGIPDTADAPKVPMFATT